MQVLKKDGKLSSYGFSCGYVERNRVAQMYKEGGAYYVETNTVQRSFDTLKEAKTFFKEVSKTRPSVCK